MRVIARRTLREYYTARSEVKAALEAWYALVRRADWKQPGDVLQTFPKARLIGKDRVIFDIQRNRYRLVVQIAYVPQIVYIRFVGTHKEYDAINVEEI